MTEHELPDWVAPGGPVFELHCSASTYKTVKVVAATIAEVTARSVVLTTGSRYRTAELSPAPPASVYRDDPKTHRRYYLLVGPDDPRAVAPEGKP